MSARQDLRLAFSDFWPHFEPAAWPPVRVLGCHFALRLAGGSSVVVCGPYGRSHVRRIATKVCWSHEAWAVNRQDFDFTVGFDVLDDPTHLRFPSFASHLLGHGLDQDFWPRPSFEVWRERPHFCNFIYDNGAPPERKEFFEALARRRHVLAPGRVCRNTTPIPGGRWIADWRRPKLTYQRGFRFTIAFENLQKPGYTSEKAVDALIAGTIPIYWGNPDVDLDIDTSALILAADFDSLEDLADHVCEVDDDEALARRYLEPECPMRCPIDEWSSRLVGFFDEIVDAHASRISQTRRAVSLTLRDAYLRLGPGDVRI
jgi:alpha(1,3/1,4) fucosyltransferase